MDVVAYYKSLSLELEALKNRVRNFIDNRHWLTDGEWEESVLRAILISRLPESVCVGRGFILSWKGASTQCDIMHYRASSPVLFRQGDLVIIPAEAVLGVIEVKTNLGNNNFGESVKKLASIGELLDSQKHLGLFSYNTTIENHDYLLKTIQAESDKWTKIISNICLGNSTYVKWWIISPTGDLTNLDISHQSWHSYHLDNMAAGYFLTNVINDVCKKELMWNQNLWFPDSSKEIHKTGEIQFKEKR